MPGILDIKSAGVSFFPEAEKILVVNAGFGLQSVVLVKHADSVVRWRVDQEAGGFGGCQGCTAGPVKTGRVGIIGLTLGAFHGPLTLMLPGLRITPSDREIQSRKRRARPEGLEPPTRCSEGSRATPSIKGNCSSYGLVTG